MHSQTLVPKYISYIKFTLKGDFENFYRCDESEKNEQRKRQKKKKLPFDKSGNDGSGEQRGL
jgi:hypothetical protein